MKADSNPTNEKTAETVAEQEESAKPKAGRKKASASVKSTSTASSRKRRTSSASKAKQTTTTSAEQKTATDAQTSEKKPSTRRRKTKTDGQPTTKTATRKPATRRSTKKTTPAENTQPEPILTDQQEPVEAMAVVKPILVSESTEAIGSTDDTLANAEPLPSMDMEQKTDEHMHEAEASQPTEESEPAVNPEVVDDGETPIVEADNATTDAEPMPQSDDSETDTEQAVAEDTETPIVDGDEETTDTEQEAVEDSEAATTEPDDTAIESHQTEQQVNHATEDNPETVEAEAESDDSGLEEHNEPIPDATTEPVLSSDDTVAKTKWYTPVVQTHRRIKDFFQRHFLIKLAVKCLTILLSLCLFLTGVAAATYLVFLEYTYVRIEDEEDLDINRPKMWYVSTKTDYTMMSYHIGYGIYDKDFSYLMDKDNGHSGSSNIAEDKADVINNLNGIINAAKQSSCDFYLFQGVDTASTRSHMINEQDILNEAFRSYSKVFATNYHTKYIFYPIGKNIGTITGGMGTYSRYRIGAAVRRSLPSEVSGLSKHSSMDVCASISYLPVRNTQRYLVVINLDLPSYSKQNLDAQWEQLRAIMEQEYADGNYVIVGGNWSRDMSGNEPSAEDSNMPTWFEALSAEQMPEHFSLVKPENGTDVASHRSGEQAYAAGSNRESIPDGFIVSDNITAKVSIQDTAYEYSHHNPVVLSFRLNNIKK